MVIRKCLTCNRVFYTKPVHVRKGKGKYCSYKCYWESLKGSHPERWTKRILTICKQCNKSFYTYQNRIRDNRGKFCSKKCFNKSKITSFNVRCKICRKTFKITPSQIKKGGGKHCSKKCKGIGMRGENHPRWKGSTMQSGYIYIYKPKHPYVTKNGYVFEHRLVFEKFLGRFLKPKEIIHHINENRSDNRLENLMYFENVGQHLKYHAYLRKKLREK